MSLRGYKVEIHKGKTFNRDYILFLFVEMVTLKTHMTYHKSSQQTIHSPAQ